MQTNFAWLAILLAPLSAAASSTAFINELHYDNAGGDVGEGIEIAGTSGTSVSGWQLILYNGSAGTVYDEIALDGIISDQQNGFGTLFFATSMQNGAPDGVALVDASGLVIQFLSYEGAFTATSGAAAGLSSIDIGVSESSDTPAGWSLQLTGTGTGYADFKWSQPQLSSYNNLNSGQTFAPVPLPASLPLLAAALVTFRRRRRAIRSHQSVPSPSAPGHR